MGKALKSTANGSCFFNALGTGAWGGGVRRPSETDVLARPLRLAVLLAGVRRLRDIGQSASSFFRTMEAYDGDVLDLATGAGLDTPTGSGLFTEEVSRALLVLALSTILEEGTEGSSFCVPLAAEALGARVRFYLPGTRSVRCE